MEFYYNPLNIKCKSITGGIAQNQSITINIYGKATEPCDFIMIKDGQADRIVLPMNITSHGYSIDLCLNDTGLYFYGFFFPNRDLYFAMGNERNGIFTQTPAFYQLLVYTDDYSTPDWFKGGVMYQIFPDRFRKSGDRPIKANKILRYDWGGLPAFRPNERGIVENNDFFGGNLKGIEEKLDYLKSLNISVIYLNPIFEAYSNHRYDTGNYLKIDTLLGDEEDLKSLITKANELGIKIILDGVFNHTGDDSIYFNKYGRYDEIGAYQSKDSKYYDWYNFHEHPDKYDSWWGISTLPAVNEFSSFNEFINGKDGVIQHWLKLGIGGYRLDVVDELPDAFVENLRSAAKEINKDAIVIGEVWEDASNKIAYGARRRYFQGKELDSVMNYPLKDAIINFVLTNDTSVLLNTIDALRDNYPKQALDCLMNILGTHDTIRILTALSQETAYTKEEMAVKRLSPEKKKETIEKLKVATLLQYTLFGVPSVYYGDETGMEGYTDPFCRFCFDWLNIDQDLYEFYKRLGEIRNCPVFKDGIYRTIFKDKSLIVFERVKDGKSLIVYVNRADTKYTIKFNGKNYEQISKKEYVDKHTIQPNSFGILYEEII